MVPPPIRCTIGTVTSGQADQWIIASAAVTGGIYAYLKWRGAQTAPVPVFVTAWGVVYVTLSLMALPAPGLGAGFAMLVMVSDLLANGKDLADEINKVEGNLK